MKEQLTIDLVNELLGMVYYEIPITSLRGIEKELRMWKKKLTAEE